MILKSKAKSRSSWKEDSYGYYEQFRPEWFNFEMRSDDQPSDSSLYKDNNPFIELHSAQEGRKRSHSPFSASSRPIKSKRSYFRESFSFLTTLKHQWINEELFFAMNKLSLLGLVITLMFLGTLFFLSGFLMAVNLYGIGDPKGQAQMASANPSHLPSPGYIHGHHQPTFAKKNPGIVAPQYATVGGVAMVHQPRLPSNVQQYNKPRNAAYPVQQSVMMPGYSSQQQPVHNPYPPQAPIQQNVSGYASYPSHVPVAAAPGYNPSYAGSQPPMVVPTSAPVYRGAY